MDRDNQSLSAISWADSAPNLIARGQVSQPFAAPAIAPKNPLAKLSGHVCPNCFVSKSSPASAAKAPTKSPPVMPPTPPANVIPSLPTAIALTARDAHSVNRTIIQGPSSTGPSFFIQRIGSLRAHTTTPSKVAVIAQ